MGKGKTGKILELLTTLSTGDSFYTESHVNTITSYASKAGVKCSTQKVFVIEGVTGDEPMVKKIIKVTVQ